MTDVVISGSGLHTPAESISNEELVESFNRYVEKFNREHAAEIEAGSVEPLQPSSAAFIEKASGIKSRYVVDKAGILDVDCMCPRIPTRSDDEPSLMCEMGMDACRKAMQVAGVGPEDIDAVIVAASNMQRAYPAMAVELQSFLGIDGWAYDMNVACASAAFSVQTAVDAVRNGNARRVLVVNPEICTGHLNFRDRDSHFIFGDAATALVVENRDGTRSNDCFDVLGTRLATVYSNNIRNNFGFLNRAEIDPRSDDDRLFVQNGRRVFKEVVPLVSKMIVGHLEDLGIAPTDIARMWLHQANLSMNQLISKKILGRAATDEEAPTILDRYANTSSAGSVIAFCLYHDDLEPGQIGVLSGFGAGYSAGSIVLRRC